MQTFTWGREDLLLLDGGLEGMGPGKLMPGAVVGELTWLVGVEVVLFRNPELFGVVLLLWLKASFRSKKEKISSQMFLWMLTRSLLHSQTSQGQSVPLIS